MVEYRDDDWDEGQEFRGDEISVISGGLLEPIGALVERLISNPPRSHPDSVGENENGHCVAIITLLFLAFESFIGRAGHLRRMRTSQERDGKTHAHTTAFLKALAPEFPEELLSDLGEIYVLRDAIAHAHIWTIEYVIRESGTQVTDMEKHPGYGNKRHDAMVDARTGRTSRLDLRVIPSRIGLDELGAVFRILRAVLRYLVDAGVLEEAVIRRGIRYRSHRHFDFWALEAEIASLRQQKRDWFARQPD